MFVNYLSSNMWCDLKSYEHKQTKAFMLNHILWEKMRSYVSFSGKSFLLLPVALYFC